jgi:hypothetical protein
MDRVKREKPELVQKIIDGGLSSRAAEQIITEEKKKKKPETASIDERVTSLEAEVARIPAIEAELARYKKHVKTLETENRKLRSLLAKHNIAVE